MAGSWRSRATPVDEPKTDGSWRSRATPVDSEMGAAEAALHGASDFGMLGLPKAVANIPAFIGERLARGGSVSDEEALRRSDLGLSQEESYSDTWNRLAKPQADAAEKAAKDQPLAYYGAGLGTGVASSFLLPARTAAAAPATQGGLAALGRVASPVVRSGLSAGSASGVASLATSAEGDVSDKLVEAGKKGLVGFGVGAGAGLVGAGAGALASRGSRRIEDAKRAADIIGKHQAAKDTAVAVGMAGKRAQEQMASIRTLESVAMSNEGRVVVAAKDWADMLDDAASVVEDSASAAETAATRGKMGGAWSGVFSRARKEGDKLGAQVDAAASAAEALRSRAFAARELGDAVVEADIVGMAKDVISIPSVQLQRLSAVQAAGPDLVSRGSKMVAARALASEMAKSEPARATEIARKQLSVSELVSGPLKERLVRYLAPLVGTAYGDAAGLTAGALTGDGVNALAGLAGAGARPGIRSLMRLAAMHPAAQKSVGAVELATGRPVEKAMSRDVLARFLAQAATQNEPRQPAAQTSEALSDLETRERISKKIKKRRYK